MSIKKKILLAILTLAVILVNIGILTHQGPVSGDVSLHLTVKADAETDITIFYTATGVFDSSQAETIKYSEPGKFQELTYKMDSLNSAIRLDLGDSGKEFEVKDVYYESGKESVSLNPELFEEENAVELKSLNINTEKNGTIKMKVTGEDPYVAVNAGPNILHDEVLEHLSQINMIKNVIYVLLLDLACLILIKFRKKVSSLPIELIQNRKLILNLSKNDFKTKYAGSYLGITWAFVQPIITVLVYWFVFQVGLRSGNVGDFPFVLWLVSGLVPWFFFQDTLNGGTNALIEYSYLVKKVVFKISVLPIVKAISALFVHAFFVLFTLVLYSGYGYYPDLYTLQVIYYSFALFVFTLGICYATCAIVIFFRDLTQIINIVLQVGIWITPIMWNIEVLGERFPTWLIMIFKVNPLYYVVNGYRDALINKIWFWERFDLTFCFWGITAILFAIGTIVFKRLKVHFADVL